MRQTEMIMGMPMTVGIPDRERLDGAEAAARFRTADEAARAVFDLLRALDRQFSPYQAGSETSRIDRGELDPGEASPEMREVLRLADETRRMTDGYFDVWFRGRFDPSGLVKGWALQRAAELLASDGFASFCIDGGGDLELRGSDDQARPWQVGIRSPFEPAKVIRVLSLQNRGIATSGTYIRGNHIYNPRTGERATGIASMTIIGPNVLEADRLATAAFAMGPAGIRFMAGFAEFDAYMVDRSGVATYTPGFARYFS
jgi:thiamine biosynthesis lipoprotein